MFEIMLHAARFYRKPHTPLRRIGHVVQYYIIGDVATFEYGLT